MAPCTSRSRECFSLCWASSSGECGGLGLPRHSPAFLPSLVERVLTLSLSTQYRALATILLDFNQDHALHSDIVDMCRSVGRK